jgi:hypothetical protein
MVVFVCMVMDVGNALGRIASVEVGARSLTSILVVVSPPRLHTAKVVGVLSFKNSHARCDLLRSLPGQVAAGGACVWSIWTTNPGIVRPYREPPDRRAYQVESTSETSPRRARIFGPNYAATPRAAGIPR